jgi:hypothetical protein
MPPRGASIKRTLTAIIMATTAVALLLAAGTFVVYDYVAFRGQQVANLRSMADVLASGNADPLASANREVARATLAALAVRPDIMRAYVLTVERAVLAKYHRRGILDTGQPPGRPRDTVGPDRLTVVRAVTRGGAVIGTVYLEADRVAQRARVARFAEITAAVLLVSLGVAFLLAARPGPSRLDVARSRRPGDLRHDARVSE